jgi:hypothetical protein
METREELNSQLAILERMSDAIISSHASVVRTGFYSDSIKHSISDKVYELLDEIDCQMTLIKNKL